jgi:hypothetical protein
VPDSHTHAVAAAEKTGGQRRPTADAEPQRPTDLRGGALARIGVATASSTYRQRERGDRERERADRERKRGGAEGRSDDRRVEQWGTMGLNGVVYGTSVAVTKHLFQIIRTR